MHGQTVCRKHGGMAPQNLRKAEERLRDLEHPAISQLARLIDHADTDAVKLAAARYLLECLGHSPKVKIQAEQEVVIRVVDVQEPRDFLHNGHVAERRN